MGGKYVALVVFIIVAQSSFALSSKHPSKEIARCKNLSKVFRNLQATACSKFDEAVSITFRETLKVLDDFSQGNKSVTGSNKFITGVQKNKEKTIIVFCQAFGSIFDGLSNVVCPKARASIKALVNKIECRFRHETIGVIFNGLEMVDSNTCGNTRRKIEVIRDKGHAAAKNIIKSIFKLIRECTSGLSDKCKSATDIAEKNALSATTAVYLTPYRGIQAIVDFQLRKKQIGTDHAVSIIKSLRRKAHSALKNLAAIFFCLFEILHRG